MRLPLGLTIEQLGDRCRPIVIYDVVFGNRRGYGNRLAKPSDVQSMVRDSPTANE